MNNNSPCPTEEVVHKKLEGGVGGGIKKEKQNKTLLRKINDFSQCNTENNVITSFSLAEM